MQISQSSNVQFSRSYVDYVNNQQIITTTIGAINSRLVNHDFNNYLKFSSIDSNIADINTKLSYIDNGLVSLSKNLVNIITKEKSDFNLLDSDISDLYSRQSMTDTVLAWQSEQQAEILRGMGQSGLYLLRQYTYNAKEPENRRFIANYTVESQHVHSNYNNLVGTAELSAIINGYYIRTRHNDYKLVKPTPVGSAFLSTIEIPPPEVPGNIKSLQSVDDQVTAMRQLFQQYANGGWPEGFAFNLSYLEVWFEPFKLTNTETFASDRHRIVSKSAQQDLEQVMKYNTMGFKNINENTMFNAPVVKFVNSDGTVDLARIKYRIAAIDLSSLGDIRNNLEVVQDYLLENYGNGSSYFKRYRLKENVNYPGFLDTVMSMIPGLDGEGANLDEVYRDLTFNTDVTILDYSRNKLNIGYYNRYAVIPLADASGFSGFMRSFNDPYLFVAMNTRNEVYGPKVENRIYKASYAIPLEIILRTCLESWNPYNLPLIKPGMTLTGDGTQTSPLNGYTEVYVRNSSYYYITPISFYSGRPDSLSANTVSGGIWINDSNGTPRNVYASGIFIDLPPITGLGTIKIRHAVFPVYHEGGYVFAYNSRVNKLQSEDITRLAQANVLTTGINVKNSMNIDSIGIRTTNLENRASNTDYYLDKFNSSIVNIQNRDNDQTEVLIKLATDSINKTIKDLNNYFEKQQLNSTINTVQGNLDNHTYYLNSLESSIVNIQNKLKSLNI